MWEDDTQRRLLDLPGRFLLAFLLPALLGTAAVPYAGDAWIEVRTTNFRLISNAGKAVTVDVAERLEQFRAMAPILTGATRVESALPVQVFVFGDDATWSHFRSRDDTAGYFLRDAEADYIALDVSRVEGERGFEIVFHEYVHFLSRNRKSRIHQPTWYEEGFADAISTARIENGKILVGLVPGGRAALLEEKKWLPLERVVTARGYADLGPDDMAMFYAQSWLLVHRLTWGHVAGLEPRHEEALRYLQRVGSGQGEEDAFRETLGTSFGRMQKELRGYLDRGPPQIVLRDEPPTFPFDPRIRELAALESLLLLGELQLARGDDGAAEAEALARRALQAESESPRALLLLAESMAQQGTDPGRSLTERALALDPDSPAVVRRAAHVGLTTLRQVQLEDRRRRDLAVATRDLYARAVKLAPDIPAAHAGLGYAQLALGQPAEANQSL